MSDIRVAEFWPALKARLTTLRMDTLLYGAGRIYHVTEDFADPEGAENVAWGRLVIIPVTLLWQSFKQEAPGATRAVDFMLRAEVNDFENPNYDVSDNLEAIHEECYTQLEFWTPQGFERMVTAFMVYRTSPPQVLPQWDEGRHLWMMSADYRFEAAAVGQTP